MRRAALEGSVSGANLLQECGRFSKLRGDELKGATESIWWQLLSKRCECDCDEKISKRKSIEDDWGI